MGQTIRIVNLLSIRHGSLLFVKKRDFWTFPGGKIKKGESDWECAIREQSEELPKSSLDGKNVYFDKFYGLSPSGGRIEVICYFGNIEGDISPGAEISAARRIPENKIFLYPLSAVTILIVEKLREGKFI